MGHTINAPNPASGPTASLPPQGEPYSGPQPSHPGAAYPTPLSGPTFYPSGPVMAPPRGPGDLGESGDGRSPWWMSRTKQIGALATALTAVASLLFLLVPSLQPAPPPPAPTPTALPTQTPVPATMGGQLTILSLSDSAVPWQQYKAMNDPCTGPDPSDPNEPGITVKYSVELLGMVGRNATVSASIVDTVANQTVETGTSCTFQAEAADDTADDTIWLSIASVPSGTYVVHLALDNDYGVELDSQDSESFTVTS